MAVCRRLATAGRFVSFVIRRIRRETGRSNGAAERRKSSRRLRPRCQGRDLVNRFIRSTMQWVSLRLSSAIKRARLSAETSRHKERYFATPSPLLLTLFPALYTRARPLHSLYLSLSFSLCFTLSSTKAAKCLPFLFVFHLSARFLRCSGFIVFFFLFVYHFE